MDNKFEKENIMDANNNMQETQIKPSNENIHGWLSFFLFCIGLRGAFNFIYLLATFKISSGINRGEGFGDTNLQGWVASLISSLKA